MTAETRPIKVFYSYSHKDKKLRAKLETCLSALNREGVIQEWHDGCIQPGQEWEALIYQQLAAADLVLLLISPNFIESEFCYRIEMKQALERHEAGQACVIPIILRHTDWETSPFSKLHCLPEGGRPVTAWRPQDRAFLDIAKGIRKVAAARCTHPASTGPTPLISRSKAARLRTSYLALMAKEWRVLRLAGLDPAAADPRSQQPLTLEQVYISLDTTTPRLERGRTKDNTEYSGFGEKEPPLSAVEALVRAPEGRMILLGQPGSGKSTFARHLAFVMAQVLRGAAKLKDQLPDWPGPRALLPVFVSLGRLASSLTPQVVGAARIVEDFIRQQVNDRPDLAGYSDPMLEELENKGGLVIFDGLDEVPSQYRPTIRETVNNFAALYARCKVLVTCRTYSYRQDQGWHLEGWPVHELAPLNPNKINTFIDAWYTALGTGNTALDYRTKADTLKTAMGPTDYRGLAELAGNPLILTVMAIVHTHRSLPGSRVEVYRECVDILLLRWHTERTPGMRLRTLTEELQALGISDSKLNQGLLQLAYEAYKANDRQWLEGKGRALVSERILRSVMEDYLGHEGFQLFRNYCQSSNGLLLADGVVQPRDAPRGQAVFAFPHLSFQEYLAALYLRQLELSVAVELAGEPAWREVIRFLGESLCFGREVNIGLAQSLLEEMCPEEPGPTDDRDWRQIGLAGELLPIVRGEAARRQRRPSLEQRIAHRLVELLETPTALAGSLVDRVAAGRSLAVVGDPRRGVGLQPDGKPDLLWVRIPGTAAVRASGQFPNFTGLRLGNGTRPDPDARDDENWPAPAQPLELQDFELAVYPVTVAQFRLFIEQGGYREDRYWSETSLEYRREAPRYWGDPTWTLANHPVIDVTWYEAEAYCNWLNERLPPAQAVRLPTEAEWEWAARGPEGRRYPWGDEWESWRCNSSESGINRTSAVGCFPGSAENSWWKAILSDSGAVHDLAGNVWEWTASEYSKDYSMAHQSALNTNLQGDCPCVVRGGSWYSEPEGLRGAARNGGDPLDRNFYRGFRLART